MVQTTIRLQFADTGKVFSSEKARILLGRNPDCDLAFPEDRKISRVHAEILISGDKMWIRDCGSVNGTRVNGKLLESGQLHPLKEGDLIALAGSRILVVLEKEEPESSAELDWRNDTCGMVDLSWMENGEAWESAVCSPEPAGEDLLECSAPGFFAPEEPVSPPMPCMPPMPAPPAPSMAWGQEEYSAPARPAPPPMPSMASAPAPKAEAPASKKKGGFLSSLFGKKPRNSDGAAQKSAPATPPVPETVTADDVQFRSTAPTTILPGEYFPVKIMMYREDDFARADRESAAVADQVKSASSSIFQAKRDQQFRIALQSPDMELDCESQVLRWNGKFAAADFEVYLPEDFGKRQLRLRGRVYSGDAVLTDLKLILQIGVPQYGSIPCEKVRLRSAFISYASADRAKVVARIQGIQLACPDMDLFFDVESLRRGEHWEGRLYREISNRDLFYLFWSQNAAKSQWVQKELDYALSHKTADYIEPIPLEAPEICPPPSSLMDKHFNDWTLRYLGNQ